MKKTILLSTLFLIATLTFCQTTRQQQKLYSRTAFEKYELQPEVQWISILMKGRFGNDFDITINQIKIKGTTNKSGSYVYKLPTNFKHDKMVTVRIEVNPESKHKDKYETIKLRMTIGELVNRTHVIEPTSKIKFKKCRNNKRGHGEGITHF